MRNNTSCAGLILNNPSESPANLYRTHSEGKDVDPVPFYKQVSSAPFKHNSDDERATSLIFNHKLYNMQDQNYKNHSRYVPMWHFVTGTAIILLLAGSFINLNYALRHHTEIYAASLICLAAIIFIMMFWYARAFALRAQDRAIRAEERMRYFILTGKPLDSNLRMGQIIALRFASDEELVALTQQAVDEKLKGSEIKKRIKNWRPDYHRA